MSTQVQHIIKSINLNLLELQGHISSSDQELPLKISHQTIMLHFTLGNYDFESQEIKSTKHFRHEVSVFFQKKKRLTKANSKIIDNVALTKYHKPT